MIPDKYEVFRLAESLEPADRQWLQTMLKFSETIEIKKAIRTTLEQHLSELGTVETPRYEGAIYEKNTVMQKVMLAIASLSRNPDDLFPSAKINEVIAARIGRGVNVAIGSYEAIRMGYMQSKPLSPRRYTYGLTENGWEYVRGYMEGTIKYTEEATEAII
jgi:hypothetical protein